MHERPPVVIAGAGPTGLMCALALGAQGIPVVVCEAEASLTHDLRAGSYHPPTQDMMAKYGITRRMQASAHGYFGHRVIGFEQKGERLKVRVESDGIPGTFEASWLVGADGGRSTVRKLLPIEFEGFTWPEQFLVVSTPYDFSPHGYALNTYVADPVEWAALFKMPDAGPPGVWRVVFPCDPGMPDDALLDAQHVEAKMKAFHAQGSPYEVRHKVIYRVHQRVASEWRVGRVLLAGDAAHLNNPLGAFGLNSGIHDAVNL